MKTGFFANLIGGKGADIIESVATVADKFITTPHEKEMFNADVQKEINRHVEAMTESANKELEIYMADMANARSMQIEALRQDDKFAKRFIYYLASGVLLLTFIFDACFFFVEYPEKNHDIIMMIAGTLNTTGFAAIIYFFFGSSKSSSDKQRHLETIEPVPRKTSSKENNH